MDTQSLTPEQVKNNYEFKVVRRIVMDKYKWIKDVTIDEDELNKYNLIFLNIHVDLDKYIEQNNAVPVRFLRSFKGETYNSSFISTAFEDMDYYDGKQLQDELDDMMMQVRKTAAIPPELKLPQGRRFTPGQYIIHVPQDVNKYYTQY